MLDKKLLSILVCPVTKKSLAYNDDTNELISIRAGLAFPIRDGFPVMLESEARALTDAEKEQAEIKSKSSQH